jgi:hypothetical protein
MIPADSTSYPTLAVLHNWPGLTPRPETNEVVRAVWARGWAVQRSIRLLVEEAETRREDWPDTRHNGALRAELGDTYRELERVTSISIAQAVDDMLWQRHRAAWAWCLANRRDQS